MLQMGIWEPPKKNFRQNQNRSKAGTDCEIAPPSNTKTSIQPSALIKRTHRQPANAISLSVPDLRKDKHLNALFVTLFPLFYGSLPFFPRLGDAQVMGDLFKSGFILERKNFFLQIFQSYFLPRGSGIMMRFDEVV